MYFCAIILSMKTRSDSNGLLLSPEALDNANANVVPGSAVSVAFSRLRHRYDVLADVARRESRATFRNLAIGAFAITSAFAILPGVLDHDNNAGSVQSLQDRERATLVNADQRDKEALVKDFCETGVVIEGMPCDEQNTSLTTMRAGHDLPTEPVILVTVGDSSIQTH